MPLPKPIVIGNWKMNGRRADAVARVEALLSELRRAPGGGTLGVCPPATLLTVVDQLLGQREMLLGGQDCSSEPQGAHTGDLSADMLKDAGCQAVIVGHSERRHGHGESDALVRAKAEAALAAGLMPILCIGETEAQWTTGQTLDVLARQLDGSLPGAASADTLIVAYEPVWAIGTGRTPSLDDIAGTHAHLRRRVGDLALLYGGSVKSGNAREILAVPEVDGALVGGASLDATEFWAIYTAGQDAG
ncbi:MAG TPA: triose-phosphate isomerase [Geminicoccaceae bacterium]|nr:triose-phosphate isomerase [Geminicoccaceae bacterium]